MSANRSFWQYPYLLALVLLLLGSLFLEGIRLRDQILWDRVSLKVNVTVPEGLPEPFVWENSGGETIEWNPGRDYTGRFQQGWSECLVAFLWSPRWFTEAPMNPFDQSLGPSMKQLPGLYMGYEKDGWEDCQKQLASFAEKHGTSTVRRLLRRKYGCDRWEVLKSIEKLHGVGYSVAADQRI